MTASPEGEYEVNNINDENESEHDHDHTYNKPDGEKLCINKELLLFLKQNDLMEIKDKLISSKLTLNHLKEVEKCDLDELCNDLKITPSQKIRFKHTIKSLQKKSNKKPKKSNPKKVEKKKSKMKDRIKSKMIKHKFKKKNYKEIKKVDHKLKIVNEGDNDINNVRKVRSKLVIVGEAGVGKTTLQKSIMGWEFEANSKATFAVSSMHKKCSYKYTKNRSNEPSEKASQLKINVDYEIFDTPGLERFADIITLYLRGALAVIVVYDIINKRSFEKAKWWINYIENNASGYDKIILIANKIDITKGTKVQNNDNDDDKKNDEDEYDDDEDVDIVTKGRLYATEHGISFLEISAKTKDNINVLLKWINKQSKNKIKKCPQIIDKNEQSIKLHESLSTKTGNKLLDKLETLNQIRCCGFV